MPLSHACNVKGCQEAARLYWMGRDATQIDVCDKHAASLDAAIKSVMDSRIRLASHDKNPTTDEYAASEIPVQQGGTGAVFLSPWQIAMDNRLTELEKRIMKIAAVDWGRSSGMSRVEAERPIRKP